MDEQNNAIIEKLKQAKQIIEEAINALGGEQEEPAEEAEEPETKTAPIGDMRKTLGV